MNLNELFEFIPVRSKSLDGVLVIKNRSDLFRTDFIQFAPFEILQTDQVESLIPFTLSAGSKRIRLLAQLRNIQEIASIGKFRYHPNAKILVDFGLKRGMHHPRRFMLYSINEKGALDLSAKNASAVRPKFLFRRLLNSFCHKNRKIFNTFHRLVFESGSMVLGWIALHQALPAVLKFAYTACDVFF